MKDTFSVLIFLQAMIKAIVCFAMADLGYMLLPIILGSTLMVDYFLIDYVVRFIKE